MLLVLLRRVVWRAFAVAVFVGEYVAEVVWVLAAELTLVVGVVELMALVVGE